MFRVLLAGLIAGWLTGKLMQGRGYGILADILLGLIGAVIAHTPSRAGIQAPVFRSPATRSRQLLGFSNDAIA